MVVPLISLEEYLATDYEPDCDYVDGVLEGRNAGKWDHSNLQSAIDTYLRVRKKRWGTRIVVEQRIQVTATSVRIPDVCMVSRDTAVEQVLTTPPMLCIEVLSPDDRFVRVEQRIKNYLDMGVPCVWVFDPEDRTVFEYTRTGQRRVTEETLRLSGTPVEIHLPELFADLE